MTGIEVLVEASSGVTTGQCKLDVTLSWDDGTSETAAKTISLTGNQTPAHRLGGSSDTWGRAWVGSEFDNGNFVVILTNDISDGACTGTTLFLDYFE